MKKGRDKVGCVVNFREGFKVVEKGPESSVTLIWVVKMHRLNIEV